MVQNRGYGPDPGRRDRLPGALRLWFQRVPEPKTGKNRLHLDLHADDVDAEAGRLVGLGARELGRHEDWIVPADPERQRVRPVAGLTGRGRLPM